MTTGRDLQARLLETFAAEASERLRAIEQGLLAIEADGDQREIIGELFREAHSLKGAAQVVGRAEVAARAHSLEAALADLRRSGEVSADDLKGLFDSTGAIAELIGAPGPAESRGPGRPATAEPAESVVRSTRPPSTIKTPASRSKPRRRAPTTETSIWQAAGDESVSAPPRADGQGTAATTTGTSEPEPAPRAANAVRAGSVRVVTDRLDDVLNRVPDLLAARRRQAERHAEIGALRRSISVHGGRWRELSGQVGRRTHDAFGPALPEDLTGLASRLGADLAELERDAARLAAHSRRDRDRLAALTEGLGTDLLNLRLVPVESLFDPFPRMVRDLAAASGKRIRLYQVGWQTEVDREVLERVKDPVMHLLRNAVDHGIEPEAERVAAGKAPTGTITLEASQREGGITIEVRDDGRGVDPAAVLRAALAAGIPKADLVDPTDGDAVSALLLRAGVSTAHDVTDVSGRGVGLDVVKEQVARLGGRVRIVSEVGRGTTVSLGLPLTVLMAHVLLIRVADRTFGLPIGMIQRCLRLTPDLATDVAGRPALRLADATIPIIALHDLLGVADAETPGTDHGSAVAVLVADADRRVALIVDRVVDERHLVVNGLGPLVPIRTEDRLVAGATLVNENEVVLILDGPSVVSRALTAARGGRRTTRGVRIVGDAADDTEGVRRTAEEPRQISVLVVDDSITTRTLEQSILAAAGFRVATAEDGMRGLAAARREAFDVIVADVEMPSLDGVEMTRRLKGDPATRDIPIILLTALETPEQQMAGLSAGADAYLLKSGFDQEQLIAAIRGLVG